MIPGPIFSQADAFAGVGRRSTENDGPSYQSELLTWIFKLSATSGMIGVELF